MLSNTYIFELLGSRSMYNELSIKISPPSLKFRDFCNMKLRKLLDVFTPELNTDTFVYEHGICSYRVNGSDTSFTNP